MSIKTPLAIVFLATYVLGSPATTLDTVTTKQETSDSKVFFFFDALCWKAKVDGVQYTYSVRDMINPTSSITSINGGVVILLFGNMSSLVGLSVDLHSLS